MNDILVSVIINNYNYGRFLKEAIDSVLNQDYKNIELIVVDDGSTDNSHQLILEYGNKLIPILKENGGQASAFNAGWRKAKGELVLFLDSDDYLLHHAIFDIVTIYRENNGRSISKMQFPLRILSNDSRVGKCIPLNNHYSNSNDIIKDILESSGYRTPPTSGNVFSCNFLKKFMPMPESEYKLCADSYLLLLAPFDGEILCINKILGIYRIHGNNGWAEGSNEEMTLNKLEYNYKLYLLKRELINIICEEKKIKNAKFLYCSNICRYELFLKKNKVLKSNKTTLSIFLLGIVSILKEREKSIFKRVLILFWLIIVFIVPGKINFIHKLLLDNWDLGRIRRKILKYKAQCLRKNEST